MLTHSANRAKAIVAFRSAKVAENQSLLLRSKGDKTIPARSASEGSTKTTPTRNTEPLYDSHPHLAWQNHMFNPISVIERKTRRPSSNKDEIYAIINGFSSDKVPLYQMSAFTMAVCCRGMTDEEISILTAAMLDSGRRLEPATDRPRVDKHSTGGLGDKISLILAPLLACCGLDVPMLSGRGLGITGGTLDKLEAIPGYRTNLSESEIDFQLRSIGCVITGTTQDIVLLIASFMHCEMSVVQCLPLHLLPAA